MCTPDQNIIYMAAYMYAYYEMRAVERFEQEKDTERARAKNGR
jgi:hypothetical protein